jgi:hypothetical protein
MLLDIYTEVIPESNWFDDWIMPIYIISIFIIFYIYSGESSFVSLLRKIEKKFNFNFTRYFHITILSGILITFLLLNIVYPLILNYDYKCNKGKIYTEKVKNPIRLQIEKAINSSAGRDDLAGLDENIGYLLSTMDTVDKVFYNNFQYFPLEYYLFEDNLFKNVPRIGQSGEGTNPKYTSYAALPGTPNADSFSSFSFRPTHYIKTKSDSIHNYSSYFKLDSLIAEAYLSALCNSTVINKLLIYYNREVNHSIFNLQNEIYNKIDTTLGRELVLAKLLSRWLEALNMKDRKGIDSLLNNDHAATIDYRSSLEKKYPGLDKMFLQKYTVDSVMYYRKIFENNRKVAKQFIDILWGLHIYQFHGPWVIEDFLNENKYNKLVVDNLINSLEVNHLDDRVFLFKNKSGILYIYMLNYKLPGISRYDTYKLKHPYTDKSNLKYDDSNTYKLTPNFFFLTFVLSVIWIIFFFNLSSINEYYKPNSKSKILFIRYYWILPILGIILALCIYNFHLIKYDGNYFSKNIFNQTYLLFSKVIYDKSIQSNIQAQVELQFFLAFSALLLIFIWVYMEKMMSLLISIILFLVLYILSTYTYGGEIDDFDRLIFQGNVVLLAGFLLLVKSPYEIIEKKKSKLYITALIERAVSKVLARNFSHHIGAHVSAGVKIKEIRKRFSEFIKNKKLEERFLDFTKDIMDDYITDRNNFLSNPLPPMQNRKLYRDIILPFVENILLIDNIASSENLRYNRETNKSRIVIKVYFNNRELCAKYEHNGTHATYPGDFPYDLKIEQVDNLSEFLNSKTTYFKDSDEEFRDILVSVPHVHAVYSIFENEIRNAAKHHKEIFDNYPLKILEISIQIVENEKGDENDDKYEIIIKDNVSEFHGKKAQDEMKERMKVSFEKEQVPTDNLGILDMKICSQLLLGKNNFNFQESDDDQSFKMQFSADNRLEYSFKMLKSRNICIIGGQPPKKNLKSSGIFYFKSVHEFLKSDVRLIYKFCLIQQEVFTFLEKAPKDLKENFLNKIPYRTLVIGKHSDEIKAKIHRVEFIDIMKIDFTDISVLLKNCWEIWINKYLYEKKVELHLFFEEDFLPNETSQQGDQASSITSKWFLFQKDWNKDVSNFKINTRYLKDYGSSKVISYKDEMDKPLEYDNKQKQIVLYDRHANCLESDNALIPQNISFELIDKSSKDFDTLFTSDPFKNPEIPYELLEAGLLKILILDERITSFALEPVEVGSHYLKISEKGFWGNPTGLDKKDNQEKEKNMTHFDAAWAGGIYIATDYSIDGVNYSPVSRDINKEKEKNRNDRKFHYLEIDFSNERILGRTDINCFSEEFIKYNFDIIIIHRGIADRMMKKDLNILENMKRKTNKIFITSGSGSLPGKTKNFEYISLDILQEAIMTKRINKYFLVQNLM